MSDFRLLPYKLLVLARGSLKAVYGILVISNRCKRI